VKLSPTNYYGCGSVIDTEDLFDDALGAHVAAAMSTRKTARSMKHRRDGLTRGVIPARRPQAAGVDLWALETSVPVERTSHERKGLEALRADLGADKTKLRRLF